MAEIFLPCLYYDHACVRFAAFFSRWASFFCLFDFGAAFCTFFCSLFAMIYYLPSFCRKNGCCCDVQKIPPLFATKCLVPHSGRENIPRGLLLLYQNIQEKYSSMPLMIEAFRFIGQVQMMVIGIQTNANAQSTLCIRVTVGSRNMSTALASLHLEYDCKITSSLYAISNFKCNICLM